MLARDWQKSRNESFEYFFLSFFFYFRYSSTHYTGYLPFLFFSLTMSIWCGNHFNWIRFNEWFQVFEDFKKWYRIVEKENFHIETISATFLTGIFIRVSIREIGQASIWIQNAFIGLLIINFILYFWSESFEVVRPASKIKISKRIKIKRD